MDDAKIVAQYNFINDANNQLIDKKNELEFILNRYQEVISKIKIEDIRPPDDNDKKLIETVQEVFKKGGGGNINDLIDTYVKTLKYK